VASISPRVAADSSRLARQVRTDAIIPTGSCSGARHSQRVSGAVFNLILGLRYQSVLGCVPKCPDFAQPVECPIAKCPIFARNFARNFAWNFARKLRTRAFIRSRRAHLPHHACSFRARNFAPSHMHLYGKLYCRVLPVLVVLYVVYTNETAETVSRSMAEFLEAVIERHGPWTHECVLQVDNAFQKEFTGIPSGGWCAPVATTLSGVYARLRTSTTAERILGYAYQTLRSRLSNTV
jgi:hypothetical protein